METDAQRYIAALRASQDELKQLVARLGVDQLQEPSYHSWTIAQVLSHLASSGELFLGWMTAALEHSDPGGRETMEPVWDAWNAKSPLEQASGCVAVNEQIVQRFESFSGEELAAMRVTLFGMMELDAAGLANLRLSETALHTWDIAVAMDPSAVILPAAVDLIVDTVGRLARFAGKSGDRRGRVHLVTSAPSRELMVHIGDGVEITPWEGDDEDARAAMPAEAYVRLIYGRLDPDHTPGVLVSGSLTLADLRAVFPGF
jgi:uncharacterized protein (TIGR03083 family)